MTSRKNYSAALFAFIAFSLLFKIKVNGDTNENKRDYRRLKRLDPSNHESVSVDNGIMYEIIGNQLFHDKTHEIQGLTYSNNLLYESFLLKSDSQVCQLDPSDGQVMKCVSLDTDYYVQGIQLYGNQGEEKLIVLTLKYHTGLILDTTSLQVIESFDFGIDEFENWGICWDETSNEFIVSTGSRYLYVWDATTLKQKRYIPAKRLDGSPAFNLDELEFVNGKILANLRFKDIILVIDPKTGICEKEYDMSDLSSKLGKDAIAAGHLNGISVSNKEEVLYVTGGKWDRIFKIKFLEKSKEPEPIQKEKPKKPSKDIDGQYQGRAKITETYEPPKSATVIIVSIGATLLITASLMFLLSHRKRRVNRSNESFSSTLFGFSYNDRVFNRSLDTFLRNQEENIQRLAHNMNHPNGTQMEHDADNFKGKLNLDEQRDFLCNKILKEIKIPTEHHKDENSNLDCNKQTEEDKNCAICLDDFDSDETLYQSPHCKHFFHKACFLVWLERSDNCPICRQNVISKDEWKLAYDSIQEMF